MSKQDSLKTQNCILKVHIDCNGCAQKVKKRLKKIDGVYSVNIDVEQGKVVVAGNVDPAKLIKKLESSGTHAELWGGVQTNQTSSSINNQFQNFQIDNFSKGGKDNKSKKGVGGGQVPANIKEVHVLKVPNKEHKSVKFHLPEDTSGDGHDDLEDYSDEEEEGYGHGHEHVHAKPMMRNGAGRRGPVGMMNVPNHKGNNGNAGVIDPTMLIKGKSGNRNLNDAKKGNKVEKKNSGDQRDNENKKNEKYMVGGEGGGIKKKSGGGGLVGRFLRFGKKSKKGVVVSADDTHKNNYNEIKEEKEGDGKLEGGGKSKNGKGNNGNGNMGQMGPMDIRAVQRHPAMNDDGGYHHQGMQMQMQPPTYNQYQQQQQYMAMMMNQQQQHQQQQQQQQGYMNNMYPQAMMYERQHPSMNYMPPPPPMPVHPMNDPNTHTFSDENVDSCTIM